VNVWSFVWRLKKYTHFPQVGHKGKFYFAAIEEGLEKLAVSRPKEIAFIFLSTCTLYNLILSLLKLREKGQSITKEKSLLDHFVTVNMIEYIIDVIWRSSYPHILSPYL
jgi:hypothetical protein